MAEFLYVMWDVVVGFLYILHSNENFFILIVNSRKFKHFCIVFLKRSLSFCGLCPFLLALCQYWYYFGYVKCWCHIHICSGLWWSFLVEILLFCFEICIEWIFLLIGPIYVLPWPNFRSVYRIDYCVGSSFIGCSVCPQHWYKRRRAASRWSTQWRLRGAQSSRLL